MTHETRVKQAGVTEAIAINASLADAALADFVTEHYDRLLRLARLVCHDASDAADAVQIGFEQAWRRRTSLRDAARVKPWLDRIVVRAAIRISKRRRSWFDRLLTPRQDGEWIQLNDPHADQMHAWTALRDAFGRLSAEQRAVVSLHLHAGYSVEETAGLVGAPLETVRSRLRLARAKLRSELMEDDR